MVRAFRPFHDEVDREVLHGRIEQLFHHPRQPVNLVYEQDVALVQIGENAHEVAAPLERRAGGGDDGRGHLVGKDCGEGGLAEPWRPGEQDVIERLRALPRRLHRHAQTLHGRSLAHVLVEPLRAELPLELRLLGEGGAAHHARLVGHGAFAPR